METEQDFKHDITNRQDIVLLVDNFYNRVKPNPVIGYIFNEVVQVNWQAHLPVMYSFWGSLLLGDKTYNGNPMIKHIELSMQTPLNQQHFSEWLRLFTETVDSLFAGPRAEEAKIRASNIAALMLHKINMAA